MHAAVVPTVAPEPPMPMRFRRTRTGAVARTVAVLSHADAGRILLVERTGGERSRTDVAPRQEDGTVVEVVP